MPRLPVSPVLSCALASLLARPAAAQTCFAPACVPDVFYPTAREAGAVSQVPANMQTFLLRRGEGWLADAGTDVDAGQAGTAESAPRVMLATQFGFELEVATRVVQRDGWLAITPVTALPAGSTLRVELADACARSRVTRTIQLGENAAIPTSLGTLQQSSARGAVSWLLDNGSCAEDTNASTVLLSLELSEAARPFADVLRYALRVDGQLRAPFQVAAHHPDLGTSLLGKGKDQLSVPCLLHVADARAMPFCSTPKVQMVGLLPDGTELSSESIMVPLCGHPSCREVPFESDRCPWPGSSLRASDPACSEENESLDNFIQDAGAGGTNARDAALETSVHDAPEADGRAGCALAPERQRAGMPLGWALAVVWLLARRPVRPSSRSRP